MTPQSGDLAPRAALRGGPGFALAVEVIGDTDGDGRPELYVAQSDGSDLLIASPLSGGEAETIAIAHLPVGHGSNAIAYAGDVDRDGYGDLWLGPRLYKGPLAGVYGWDDASATFERFLGRAVEGNFDADDDGWLDVAFGGHREDLVVQYGPFEGQVEGYDRSDPAAAGGVTVTEAGEDCGMEALRSLAAPGERGSVILIAGSATMPFCAGSLWAYDVSGPRGRELRFVDALARFGSYELSVWPDSDGDGLYDLLYLYQPLLSPLAGLYPSATDERWPPVLHFEGSGRVWPSGDVTGDGLGDLIVQHIPAEGGSRWYAVPGSVRGVGLDVSRHGVRLMSPADQWASGDLDLDGLTELIGNDSDSIWIYTGADIAAAFRAREEP